MSPVVTPASATTVASSASGEPCQSRAMVATPSERMIAVTSCGSTTVSRAPSRQTPTSAITAAPASKRPMPRLRPGAPEPP